MAKKKDGTERLQRGMTPRQTASQNIKRFPFTGEWYDAFKRPERSGVWIAWGKSGNGKTSFVMQLTKYLCQWERALFFSLEEGRGGTLVDSIERHGLQEVGNRILFYSSTPFAELKEIIRAHPHHRIIVIDSLQYLRIRGTQYIQFKEEFARDRIIIFTSHATGDSPRGSVAEDVMYDATQKIQVKVHLAISKGRNTGKKGFFVVWADGAEKYWGKNPTLEQVEHKKRRKADDNETEEQ